MCNRPFLIIYKRYRVKWRSWARSRSWTGIFSWIWLRCGMNLSFTLRRV